jgi:transposase-like protein
MPPRSRKLSLEDINAARLAYEAGATYRDLAEQFGVAMSTIRTLLVAVGVTSRPEGFQRQPQPEPAPAPPPRPAVEISPDVSGRLRIPMRTPEERRLRELQAIGIEIALGQVIRAPRGRNGLPERQRPRDWQAAGIAFIMAMRRLRAA